MSARRVWDELERSYAAGASLGTLTVDDVATSVRQRLRAWSERERPLCTQLEQHRVRKAVEGKRRWRVALDGVPIEGSRHPTIPLGNLPHFVNAHLAVFAVVSDKAILSYGARLDGLVHGALWSGDRQDDRGERTEKAPPAHARRWCAHVDFTEAPEGDGLCSHARLHVHVTPDPDAQFQARVPLPWLAPAEALDWLIAIACPELEPALPTAPPK